MRCTHPGWKRDAIGARVVARWSGGQAVRTIGGGSSFLSDQEKEAHFGLGPAERVDALVVHWPDGTTEEFPGVEADRVIELVYGGGK